ncbi:odorant receptor 46a isoform X2 [Galleria mellonella]|uniref:Odorant receptor n=1 Tax=Galleria mellonella TaxID=7137 RepID=A0ABM3MJX3_GALME|nr:odorant receptor 46a isoform X2 [Galleria mellonella]
MEKYSVFVAFAPHFKALARVAYFKIVSKDESNAKRMLYELYRFMMWFFILLYNIQHLIRVIQVRHSTEQLVDTLFILLTTLNCLGKQVAFNARSGRIHKIIETIQESTFAPTKPNHLDLLKKNAVSMSQILSFYQCGCLTCAALWTIFPFINRARGREVTFTGYLPFDTSVTSTFYLALAYMSVLITIQAFGHVTMDCTIVAFYAQAKVQIKMLRYNFEHFMDADEENIKIDTQITGTNYEQNTHKVNTNDIIIMTQKRLTNYVDHYEKIASFVKEVESIFSEAMIVQFFAMAWVICMTVYKIVSLSLLSVEFISMAMYLGCMLGQLFIYCYFGTKLKVESEFICQSVYCGDWLSLSPSFRRKLLVFMSYCSKPLALRTAYIIPMCLDTYIAVLKSSYSLFTFLNRN